MVNIAPARNNLDMAKDAAFGSPVPTVGNNLATFLGNRLSMSFTNLNCGDFGLTNPVDAHTQRERRRDRGHLQPDPADGEGRRDYHYDDDQPEGRPEQRARSPAARAGTGWQNPSGT